MLSSVDSELRTIRLRNRNRRGTNVQRQMSLLETRSPVWASLDDEQRSEAVAVLARLVVQAAAARIEDEENENE